MDTYNLKINGAGYHDYEDVGLQMNDMVIETELSLCCEAMVTPISKRCTKCLAQDGTFKRYTININGKEEEVY